MMGLASGMDTDFIVQQTLRMHQFKIDNQMRNRKLIEWRQQTHNTIKDEITSIRQTFLSNLGSKSMMSRNAFNATKATITSNNVNSSKVSIRTNAGSPLGNINVQSVNKLASGASLQTSGAVTGTNGNGFASGIRLGAMEFGNTGEKISWTQDGGTIRVGNENIKIERNYTPEPGENPWKFTNVRTGEAVDVGGWNGTGDLNLTVGDVTRTLKFDSVNNRFTEDRPGVFATDITIGTGDDARTVTITATQNQSTNAWTFTSSIGGTVGFDGEDKLVLRLGSGENLQVHELGDWAPGTGSPPSIGGKALEQQVSTASQMYNEAVLSFTTAQKDDGGVIVPGTEKTTNVTISSNDTLSEMMIKVNNSGAGVTMGYDRLTDQFTLQTQMGANIDPSKAHLSASGNGSNFLNMISGTTGALTFNEGQKAVAYINGEKVERNTNSFDFRGVSITINDTFNETYAGGATQPADTVQATLSRDTDQAFDRIKEFIDSYNAIIRRLESLLTDRKTGNEVSYKPLTDEEKSAMTDRQIEEWESIAKKGILRNDSGIQNLVSSLRRSFFEEIEGVGLSPSQIGLTTGNYFDGTGGQIMIDEDRLRAAIERDPDMVADIFIRIDNSGSSPKGVGLLHKIDGLMRDFVNTTQSTSIKNLEDSMKRANEQIQRMQERMWAEEDRLYRQFAAMESAMSKLNQQGDWFSAMLGG